MKRLSKTQESALVELVSTWEKMNAREEKVWNRSVESVNLGFIPARTRNPLIDAGMIELTQVNTTRRSEVVANFGRKGWHTKQQQQVIVTGKPTAAAFEYVANLKAKQA